MNEILNELRRSGWTVAVHNDYRLNGQPKTFWLFTHVSGVWAKGEGATDEEALTEASAQARERRPVDGGPFAGSWATLAEVERAHITAIMAQVKGNRKRAAEILGIGERTLYRRLNDIERAKSVSGVVKPIVVDAGPYDGGCLEPVEPEGKACGKESVNARRHMGTVVQMCRGHVQEHLRLYPDSAGSFLEACGGKCSKPSCDDKCSLPAGHDGYCSCPGPNAPVKTPDCEGSDCVDGGH
jgi:hypothetical protein